MNKNIKNIFYDNNNNIFVIDDDNLIYYLSSSSFVPLPYLINDVKNIFKVNGKIMIHYSDKMYFFDNDMNIDETSITRWGMDNIDQVCYYSIYDIIVILSQGKIYLKYCDDPDLYICAEQQLEKKIISIKIDNDMLITLNENNGIDCFVFTENGTIIHYMTIIHNIREINSSKEPSDSISNESKYIFDKIIKFFEYCIVLDNGDCHLLHDNNKNMEIHNRILDQIEGSYFLNNRKIDCIYNRNDYSTLIEPLLSFVPYVNYNTTVGLDNIDSISINLKPDANIRIISNSNSQIILCNNAIYFINGALKLCKHQLSYDNIETNVIIDLFKQQSDTSIYIDVNIKNPIIPQLINIIPNIFRLNSDKNFTFDHIIENIETSYGVGTTRQVYFMLRIELDEIFQENFSTVEKNFFNSTSQSNIDLCYNLGKIFYFCINKSQEKFNNLHPYFFFLIACEKDYDDILRIFKGDNYTMYKNQFLNYKNDSSLLKELDLDLKTHHDYMDYIMSSDIIEYKELYKSFAKGFMYFFERNNLFDVMDVFKIKILTDIIIVPEKFDVNLGFDILDDDVDENDFDKFCLLFNDFFDNLGIAEFENFIQNVTGTKYYCGAIKIIYGYKRQSDNGQLSYQISTCETKITFWIKPKKKIVNDIFCFLINEDINLKN